MNDGTLDIYYMYEVWIKHDDSIFRREIILVYHVVSAFWVVVIFRKIYSNIFDTVHLNSTRF